MQLTLDELRTYLQTRHDAAVTITTLQEMGGEATGSGALKQFGYGRPLLVVYTVQGEERREVIHRIRETPFGREREDDRVAAVWLDYQTFNQLPRHVPAVDMICHAPETGLRSIHRADELLLVTTYRPGRPYADDLTRVRDSGELQAVDRERVEALAAYLAQIHAVHHDAPALWRRRLRDLIGHGEGIMGLTDSYPADFALATADDLRRIEEMANAWRWRLKPLPQRLCQVHGDFHPFNIVFDEGSEFYVLDRSRGAWGEAADDVSCLVINYLFFSLQRDGRLQGALAELYERFWQVYRAQRPDEALLAVIQPWFAWRALVLASPLWYPTIGDDTRRKLLTFARRVLAADRFDYAHINDYLEAAA